jgi:hypothetical protein
MQHATQLLVSLVGIRETQMKSDGSQAPAVIATAGREISTSAFQAAETIANLGL